MEQSRIGNTVALERHAALDSLAGLTPSAVCGKLDVYAARFRAGERPSSGSKARRRALRNNLRKNPGGNGHEWTQSSYAISVSSRTLTTANPHLPIGCWK